MLKKTQALTGIMIALFLVLHLLNTWIAIFGETAYDSTQAILRPLYQSFIFEPLLLGSILIHLLIGITRIIREPKRALSGRAKLHRYSGIFLAFVIGAHILAVRGSSVFYDVYLGFSGLAFTLDFAPEFFYPYYFLFAVSGFYHGFNGLNVALARLRNTPLTGVDHGKSKFVITQSMLLKSTLAAGALSLIALLSFGGHITDIGDPYLSEYAQLVLQILNVESGS